MEGIGLKYTLVIVRRFLGPQACLGLWLALLGLIASPNGGFNIPPAAHPVPENVIETVLI